MGKKSKRKNRSNWWKQPMPREREESTVSKKCERCPRKYKGKGEWNVNFTGGILTGYLCPSCQTPEENAEAEINLATVDYARAIVRDGRAYAPSIQINEREER